ncbi:MAG: ABC transporter permease [Deltaproteobacteria bacterium]|nr:ABC transporter permease [Deltaproteobacteria bacterium]
MERPVDRLVQAFVGFFEQIGLLFELFASSIFWALRKPRRYGLFLLQCEFIGVGSLFIVMLTGLFTGLVFALQSSFAFAKFNAEALVGATVVISLCRELGPVLTGLMVTGRAGSAIATELGTMRVTEQIDALETMAVSPIQYLVVPRVLALVVVMPMLTMLFNSIGFVGAYIVGVYQAGINPGTFIGRIQRLAELSDLLGGLAKSSVFGLMIGLVACFRGMNATGGSRGVGLAATATVVTCSVAILVVDYVLTTFIIVLTR